MVKKDMRIDMRVHVCGPDRVLDLWPLERDVPGGLREGTRRSLSLRRLAASVLRCVYHSLAAVACAASGAGRRQRWPRRLGRGRQRRAYALCECGTARATACRAARDACGEAFVIGDNNEEVLRA